MTRVIINIIYLIDTLIIVNIDNLSNFFIVLYLPSIIIIFIL